MIGPIKHHDCHTDRGDSGLFTGQKWTLPGCYTVRFLFHIFVTSTRISCLSLVTLVLVLIH